MTRHHEYDLYDKCHRVCEVYNEGQAKVALRYVNLALRVCTHAPVKPLILGLELGLKAKLLAFKVIHDVTGGNSNEQIYTRRG